ncbi:MULTISPECIES: DUF6993 domain-containing protein [unclassified Arthrobacter]|uniref:DUF6993 domain-containing protein n=1 Tax=unclassified Arthrobacter TaxID=235627 RepID=UPI001D150093|nr:MULTISPECIES: hypothetical protein [unclassified Arthrobacter]MCC3275027.1 hypothetical protein [Arthrobacter sp. zg-Y20]MCC9177376.1 hypothetical protein [Arthrobacter sp. zg-Y750]MDK1315184.1 hypothetical protein [Arthrobacter sp. zg.Y20]WIB05022.1 hypothetical protein QNO06_10715 [Arthrobacter sp. zg-Y20]
MTHDPSRTPSLVPTAPGTFLRVPAVLLLTMALAVGAVGCGAAAGESGQPVPSGAGTQNAGAQTEDPAARQAGDSPEALALKARLEELAGAEPSPDRSGIMQAFVAAGFAEPSVEVSADRTPTGLDVDAIQGAAVEGGECIFGEVRDGKVTVSVLPVLAGGRCFVGN